MPPGTAAHRRHHVAAPTGAASSISNEACSRPCQVSSRTRPASRSGTRASSSSRPRAVPALRKAMALTRPSTAPVSTQLTCASPTMRACDHPGVDEPEAGLGIAGAVGGELLDLLRQRSPARRRR